MFDYISTPSDITLRSLQRLSKCDSGHYLDLDLRKRKQEKKCILNLRISTTQIKPHSPIYKVTGDCNAENPWWQNLVINKPNVSNRIILSKVILFLQFPELRGEKEKTEGKKKRRKKANQSKASRTVCYADDIKAKTVQSRTIAQRGSSEGVLGLSFTLGASWVQLLCFCPGNQ